MKTYIIRLSFGISQFDSYEYTKAIVTDDIDAVEMKILEAQRDVTMMGEVHAFFGRGSGNMNDDQGFTDYEILPLEQWIEQNTFSFGE